MGARQVIASASSVPVHEGAGVRLRRAFGYHQIPQYDPFLLLDHFHSSRPEDYLPGFPWHPHRGIETITIIWRGAVQHQDSLGNGGLIGPGAVQWMTAGSGTIHQEMPQGDATGELWGVQLWSNLPAAHKMTAPRYQEFAATEIPSVQVGDAHVRVICGQVGGVDGPVRDIFSMPVVVDVWLPAMGFVKLPCEPERNLFVFVVEGEVSCSLDGPYYGTDTVLQCADGDSLPLYSQVGMRALVAHAAPYNEPIAWGGPIVMNTREELRQAFAEYQSGTFLKHSTG